MVEVDEERCIGCGACIDACSFGAISMVNGKARIDKELCRGCMICARYCIEGAIVDERTEVKTEGVRRKLEEITEELKTGKISCERVEELEEMVTLLKSECVSGVPKYPDVGYNYNYNYGPTPGGGFGRGGGYGRGGGFGRGYRRGER